MTTNRTQQQQAADEKAELERQAAEKAELERQAAEKAEKDGRERRAGDVERQDVPADDERAKLFVVLSRTSDGQEHSSIRSAESADGLKESAVHAYGISPDDVTVYELRTV